MMCRVSDNKYNHNPATEALKSLERLPAPEYLRRRRVSNPDTSLYENLAKRRKTDSFNMEQVLNSIKPIEDSLSFPVIEWSDEDSDHSESKMETRPESESALTQESEVLSCARNSSDCLTMKLWERIYSDREHIIRSKSYDLCLAALLASRDLFNADGYFSIPKRRRSACPLNLSPLTAMSEPMRSEIVA